MHSLSFSDTSRLVNLKKSSARIIHEVISTYKQVNEAYSVLSDQRKRARYDSGQDLDDGYMGEMNIAYVRHF